MADWVKDDFMSNWDKTYVSTNLKDGVKPYDAIFLRQLQDELAVIQELKGLSSEILVSSAGLPKGSFGD